jgi:hypothetical protein
MHFFTYVASLLQAALMLVGFAQANPALTQAQQDQVMQTAQQTVTQVFQAKIPVLNTDDCTAMGMAPDCNANAKIAYNPSAPDITALHFAFSGGAPYGNDSFTLQEKNGYYVSDLFGSVTAGTNRDYSLQLTSTNAKAEAEGKLYGVPSAAMVISVHTGNNIFVPYLYVFTYTNGSWKQAAYTKLPDDGGRTSIDDISIANDTITIDVKTSGPDQNYHDTYVPKRYTYTLYNGALTTGEAKSNPVNTSNAPQPPVSTVAPAAMALTEQDIVSVSYPIDMRNGTAQGVVFGSVAKAPVVGSDPGIKQWERVLLDL